MLRVAIVGATGYSGIELIRLLHHHPHVKISKVISGSHEGQKLADIFPHLNNMELSTLEELEPAKLAREVDIVFFATPAGVSSKIIPLLIDLNVKCIDVSGDFRLRNPVEYTEWYQQPAADKSYLAQAVYGLSEEFSETIKTADLIANPGCYPTATLLGLIPGIKAGLIDLNSIVIDGKSGVSGAGRKATLGNSYSEVNENISAYKVGAHQHIPEIEQILSHVAGTKTMVNFTTHLIPLTRGMLCSIYTKLTQPITTDKVVELYQEYYQGQPFVRIRRAGNLPKTKEVLGSNYCDIGLVVDSRTNSLVIISVIDNLGKGAAGQAVQNMNIMQGWDQALGLELTPVFP